MDGILASIQGLSGQQDLPQLLTQLQTQAQILSANVAAIPQSLHALDAAQHSLGALFLLESWSRSVGDADGNAAFIDSTAGFLTACTAHQVQMAPELFVKLCRKFRDQVIAAQCPRKGIQPLKAAIRKLQPSREHLTPMHADCFQLCLLSKCYNAASELVEEDIFDVEPARTCCVPRDLYLYGRYGSQICIGRKQWARALELLLLVLTAPTMVSSAITLDCYKLYVLASLIHLGTLPPLPKVVPSHVRNMIENDARPYTELASAYTQRNATWLQRVVDANAALWNADSTLGLVKQVAESLTTRAIQRLTATYLTLSLADIAAQVHLPSAQVAEQYILRMVERRDIFAVINEAHGGGGGMVRFMEDPQRYDTPDAITTLTTNVRRCLDLADRVAATHDNVSKSKEYLKKVVSKERPRYDVAMEEYAGIAATMFQP